MAQNDFKSFAVGAGANVTPQADWEALAALVTGFQSGKASSAQINKAIRQASFIAAALAQYTSDKTGGDVLDDGDQAAFITKMAAAFGKDFQPLDATLTALAGLTGAADKLAYFNGDDTAALTALTGVGRDIIGKTTIADVLSYLGLGEAAQLAAPTATLNSSSGYFSLPVKLNGTTINLIVQFGNGDVASTSGASVWTRTANSFLIPFPNACLSIVATDVILDMPATFTHANNHSAGRVVVGAFGSAYVSKTGFSALAEGGFNWLAVGY
ncbi:gp53-like domain-containing protein [Kluyvera intermedia]|uniref:Phage tail protein n=1 Tax=Kluyvera intermedia TaxID=61648 RepID=A0AA95FV51_KLUIN|nr:phage tail protein [Kluyvera intermedia]WGL54435.1 phage tail protein [Kluyvera intermedia]